jgi:hypothetical protein
MQTQKTSKKKVVKKTFFPIVKRVFLHFDPSSHLIIFFFLIHFKQFRSVIEVQPEVLQIIFEF